MLNSSTAQQLNSSTAQQHSPLGNNRRLRGFALAENALFGRYLAML